MLRVIVTIVFSQFFTAYVYSEWSSDYMKDILNNEIKLTCIPGLTFGSEKLALMCFYQKKTVN